MGGWFSRLAWGIGWLGFIALAGLIHLTRAVWIPAVFYRSKPVELSLNGLSVKLLGQWFARDVRGNRVSFQLVEFPGVFAGHATTIVLTAGTYPEQVQELDKLMTTDLRGTFPVSIHLRGVTYRAVSPISLGGEPGIGLVGTDDTDGRPEVRIDLPSKRVAFIFGVVGEIAEEGLVKIIVESLPDLKVGGRLSTKSTRAFLRSPIEMRSLLWGTESDYDSLPFREVGYRN